MNCEEKNKMFLESIQRLIDNNLIEDKEYDINEHLTKGEAANLVSNFISYLVKESIIEHYEEILREDGLL